MKASDVPKFLVFVQSIDQGHRVVNYLRSLPSQKDARRLIRHHHSMACPECKAEGMESLYKIGDETDCLVHVSTDVLTVGVDIPGLAGVLIYDKIASLSALLQRAGRPVRERGAGGVAYLYISKSSMAEALAYVDSEAGKADKRVLDEKDPASYVPQSLEAATEDSTAEIIAERSTSSSLTASGSTTKTSGSNKKTKAVTTSPQPVKSCSASLLLVFAAHARNRCVTRQINIIYENPGVDRDCGRCSSCVGDKVPEPRAMENDSDQPSTQDTRKHAEESPEIEKVPGYMKPQTKDIKSLTTKLEHSAYILRQGQPLGSEALFISARIFLPPNIVTAITTNFLLIKSEEIFFARVRDWEYRDRFGQALWDVVKVLVDDLRKELVDRHKESLEKQRAARLHKWIVSNGFDGVKRVSLKLGTPPSPVPPITEPSNSGAPAPESPSTPASPTDIVAKIPPTEFYAVSPEKNSKNLKRKAAAEPSERKGSAKRLKKSVSTLIWATFASTLCLIQSRTGQRKYGPSRQLIMLMILICYTSVCLLLVFRIRALV
ncbi:P-loop containing nucleoside triphosphate hydrolase protein [Favolaschia claudopus]|uniref:P-loop containing nucleoside triphosphate hydrolase protein n=1 Tax=Favolaschia claudopus TaxID=2862362 RepID=A0AAW0CR41_9AGAR